VEPVPHGPRWIILCCVWLAMNVDFMQNYSSPSNTITCLITYLLHGADRVLLEKLTDYQLVKKFPSYYGTRNFIAAFTSVRHLSLSWASSIHSMPPSCFLKIRINIIISSTPGTIRLHSRRIWFLCHEAHAWYRVFICDLELETVQYLEVILWWNKHLSYFVWSVRIRLFYLDQLSVWIRDWQTALKWG